MLLAISCYLDLSCAYIVCMVCWKYVLGVECASVCTLYILSCMVLVGCFCGVGWPVGGASWAWG